MEPEGEGPRSRRVGGRLCRRGRENQAVWGMEGGQCQTSASAFLRLRRDSAPHFLCEPWENAPGAPGLGVWEESQVHPPPGSQSAQLQAALGKGPLWLRLSGND